MINWFDISVYEEKFRPNTFFIGGRRIGKTFSTFSYMYERQPFIYIRNTQIQIDESCTKLGNPFKKWNRITGHDLRLEKEKSHAIIIEGEGDNEKIIGYAAALSSLGCMRGIDLSDFRIGLFDEFIEKKKLTFNQGAYYDDLYETINSNRELEGEPPFVMILLSNAQKLNNPILNAKNLIVPIESMMKSGQKTMTTANSFICLPESQVSELKKQTAFYQGMEGTKTYEEALNNKFANDSFYSIKKRPLKEYVGLCMIDDIYIYKHKSNGKLYACSSQCLNIPTFTSKDNFSLFYRAYGKTLDIAAATGQLEFSDFSTKSTLFEILRI